MKITAKLSAVGMGVALAVGATSAYAAQQLTAAPRVNPPAESAGGTGGFENHIVALPGGPCRVFDSRVAGGKVADGVIRNVAIRGSGPAFAAQGSRAGAAGCGIPADAVAVGATIAAVDFTNVGYLRDWPGLDAPPTFAGTALNFFKTVGISASDITPLCTKGAACGTADLSIRPVGATGDIVIDISSYEIPPKIAMVAADGNLISSAGGVKSSVKTATGIYKVTFNSPVWSDSPTPQPGDCERATTGLGGGYAAVSSDTASGDTHSVFVETFDKANNANDGAFTLHLSC